jgi:hypothetical protein
MLMALCLYVTQFGGMSIDELEHYLEERQTKDRTFVGILLHGIEVSAWVKVNINVAGGQFEFNFEFAFFV